MVEWCAGYGGIHLGLKRAIPNLRVIAYGEIEAFACANLVAKMEAGLLDAAPIWTDIKTFPCEAFRDRVDILVAGYPCQPFSAAGKRLGTEDPRHLWPHIARAIRVIRPRMCFFENVEGHISLGLREVVGELEQIGYTTAWGIFSASEVEAPHQRKRVFILANDQSQRIQGHWADWLQEPRPHVGQGLPLRGGDAGCGELADANANGSLDEQQPKNGWATGATAQCGSQAWPSRPGEPQHGWEPPRVVVDAKSQRTGLRQQLCGEECGQGRALPSEPEPTGEEHVANNHRPHAGHGEQRPERELGDLSGGCGEAMGNAKGIRSSACGTEHEGLVGQLCPTSASGESAMGNADPRRLASGLDARSGAETDRGGQADIEQAEPRQIERTMGYTIDGTSSWVGHSELPSLCDSELAEIREWMVKCDNRTDELRLLGNGVVPATAERAFRVLIQQLDTPPQTH